MITADDMFTNIKVCCDINIVPNVLKCRNSGLDPFPYFSSPATN